MFDRAAYMRAYQKANREKIYAHQAVYRAKQRKKKQWQESAPIERKEYTWEVDRVLWAPVPEFGGWEQGTPHLK